ncbi:TetR/AcrR family transcriptional regulator [Pseudoxanthobacter sp. M-2]|uniref:TetR/AcrR family transcriptional regulator n=1 Tax=Pseudoxanthobacter sp. M-2 TaxID=3078754 RepID=UPI0038FC5BA6
MLEEKPDRLRRRTQETRSRETREKLLRATIDVLLESGYAGLTTALVDARAGVTSGARVHHFPTKADLVIAATAYVYERCGELGQQRAEAASCSQEPLRDYVDDCLSIYFDWPFIAALEVVLAARSDPALFAKIHPVLQRFHDGMRRTWLEALVRAGYDRTQTEIDLRLTLNLLRGMATNRIWQNDAEEYRRLIDDWLGRVKLVRGGDATTAAVAGPRAPKRPRRRA